MSTTSTAPRKPSRPGRSCHGARRVNRGARGRCAVGLGQLSRPRLPGVLAGDWPWKRVINYSPEPLTEFAKSHFGTSDKQSAVR